MKKGILVAGASVLLLSGLVAGVFAKYQTTLDEVGTGSVAVKNFVFKGNSTLTGGGSIKLAPGESQKVATLNVMNFEGEGSSYAEVDIAVKGTLSVSGGLADGIKDIGDKLEFTFKDVGTQNVASIASFTLEGGRSVTKSFDLYAEWIDTIGTTQDNSEQNALVGKSSTWSVKFVGTQH